MNATEQAIKEAVEKGEYKFPHINLLYTDGGKTMKKTAGHIASELNWKWRAEILLNPSFWQALGKAKGWGLVTEKHGTPYDEFVGLYARRGTAENKWQQTEKIEGWLYMWHRFIDALADGKDAESFFAALVDGSAAQK